MTIEGYLPKDYYYKLLKCPACGSKFKGRGVRLTKGKQILEWGNKKYCSAYCRHKAWLEKHPRIPESELDEFERWKSEQK